MGDNLQWLCYAFGAAWVIHMLYLLSISRREGRVLKQIEELRQALDDRDRALL